MRNALLLVLQSPINQNPISYSRLQSVTAHHYLFFLRVHGRADKHAKNPPA
jgi:hypothetical protein